MKINAEVLKDLQNAIKWEPLLHSAGIGVNYRYNILSIKYSKMLLLMKSNCLINLLYNNCLHFFSKHIFRKKFIMRNNDVKGKVVLIAGGCKNFGVLLSRNFASKGAKLAIHYNSESSKAESEKTLADVQAMGAEVFLFQGDLTKVANVSKFFDTTISKFWRIDIAINTVGMVLKKPFVDTTEEEYDTMSDVNSKAAYFFLQEAGKKVNENGKICTILTSLLAAYTGLYSTYAGMKATVEHFTRAASKEFGERGISVTADTTI